MTPTIRDAPGNPSGLSKSNPTEQDGYRGTVRKIADGLCKVDGEPRHLPVELEAGE